MRMHKGIKGLVGSAALAAGIALAPAGAVAEKWSVAAAWGGGILYDYMAKNFTNDVTFLTNGEVTAELFPGGTLGSPLKVTESVKNGVAQMGHSWAGYDWAIDKTAVLFGGFAGTMPSEQWMHWIFAGGGLELWKEWRMETTGLYVVPCGSLPREIFMHSHKKIVTLEDFKGVKLRTSGAWADIATTLGASTVILAGSEVFPAMERKVVDAMEWGTPSMNDVLGFAKIAKYVIIPGLHQPVAAQECVINKAAYEKLSARNKRMIEIAGKATTLDAQMYVGTKDVPAFVSLLKNGFNEIVEVDDNFKAAAKKATEEWADKQAKENKWFAKVWNHQQEFAKNWALAQGYR